MIKSILTNIRNLIGLSKFPMGKHIYCYIMDLTREERDEFKNATPNELIYLAFAMLFAIIAIIYITLKIKGF